MALRPHRDATHRAELHGSRRPHVVSDLTLVTLGCTPVDIAMSVIGEGGGVSAEPANLMRPRHLP
jgi:hypothetical protein